MRTFILQRNSKSVSLEYLNAIFTRTENKLKPEYQQLIQRLYNVDVTSLNFNDARFATKFINAKLSNVTRGRINSIVKEGKVPNLPQLPYYNRELN